VASEKVSDFFQRAASEAQDLPVWCGELYLELHRGTLTTQAACKRGNRRGELLLRDAEILDAVEHVLCGEEAGPSVLEEAPPRAVYDTFQHPEPERRRGHAGALDRAWKLLLLDQFHDILPGSSIAWVYRDCARDHEVVQVLGDLVRSDSLGRIAARVECGGAARPVLLCNTLGAARRGVWEDPDGRCRWVQVPACGYAVVDLDREPELPGEVRPVTVTEEDGVLVVANGLLRLAVDVDGTISSIRDLPAHREVLAPGRSGNLLQLHQDEPLNWDAWDIDPFYREVVEELRELEQLEVVEATPMRCRVRMVRRFRDSSLRQELVLRAGSARVDFPTEVEWRERNRLLKVAFPVQVLAREAAFEIQYGHVRRPTHTNTSWDQARFEVCGHRWADLSESGYGVALLNDCKYGYDVQGNVLRLSLLRGPTAPDPDADLGHHRFTYALLPHRGDLAAGGVIPAAGDLNSPLVARPAGGGEATLPPAQSWFSTDRPELVIDCVKVAEREEAIIVRLYEAHGSRGEGRLRVHLPLTHHGPVDLLEQGAADRPLRDGEIPITYSPFSVHTIKLTPRARDVPRPESRGS
jgi:alpha-mannosidase